MKTRLVKLIFFIFLFFSCQLPSTVAKDITVNYQPIALPFIISMTPDGVVIKTSASVRTPLGKFTALIDTFSFDSIDDLLEELKVRNISMGEFKEDDAYIILRDENRDTDTIVHIEQGKSALYSLNRLDGTSIAYAHPGNKNVVYAPSTQALTLSVNPSTLFSFDTTPKNTPAQSPEFETVLEGAVVIINVSSLESVEINEQFEIVDRYTDTCAQHTTNLHIGSQARLINYHSTTLRSTPMIPDNPADNRIGYILKDEIVETIGAPDCDHLGFWWPVHTQSGLTGWVREDDTYHTFLEPIN